MEASKLLKGIPFLRRAFSTQTRNKHTKFISIPVEEAKQIIEQTKSLEFNRVKFTPTQNSVRASALMLCVPCYDLCDRLNAKSPKELMNIIAEERTRIASLIKAGDEMAKHINTSGFSASRGWMQAKKL